jgi:hypothetical protein
VPARAPLRRLPDTGPPTPVQIEVMPMIRATVIALIVLTWFDELMANGQYTRAAFQVSRSMARYMFNV